MTGAEVKINRTALALGRSPFKDANNVTENKREVTMRGYRQSL